jgi:hypothetical protein
MMFKKQVNAWLFRYRLEAFYVLLYKGYLNIKISGVGKKTGYFPYFTLPILEVFFGKAEPEKRKRRPDSAGGNTHFVQIFDVAAFYHSINLAFEGIKLF